VAKALRTVLTQVANQRRRALNAISHELVSVENLTYVTAETVCELLRRLAGAHQGIPISVILGNARYQRCALVQAVAQELGIDLLYVPA
jgi:hypothetical protein